MSTPDRDFRLAVSAEMVFLDLPFEERVAAIHDLGFAVEIWDWTTKDLAALKGTGAHFASMTGYLRGDLTSPEGSAELLRTARESIEAAHRLGCTSLNVHGTGLGEGGLPVVPVEVVTGPMWVAAADTLSRLAELGRSEGVVFTLENLNTEVDHPGTPFARAADTLALVRAVDSPALRMNLDLYHAQIGEGNLIEVLRRSIDFVGEIQVADVPGRCEPGTGEISYPAIAVALRELGYAGVVALEAWASGDSRVALERFRAAFTARPPAHAVPRDRVRLRTTDCDLDDFVALVEQRTALADFPLAAEVVDNVLVYDAGRLREEACSSVGEEAVAGELVRALTDGPGVMAIRGAFDDTAVVDRTTAVFEAIIADEKASGGHVGDHFAKPGANDRVWNALEKLGVRDPQTFVDYYANDVIALVSRAWLGPGYQVTSQVNVVRPGGQAQDPHRDYHLGFLENDVVEGYPSHVHLLSPVLTLQGAVAHSDMPVASGPTMYLPYSHQYAPGYLAWRLPEFRTYFETHYVQLPLAKGDAVFFNPALFHGAGTNVSPDIQRVANLLQVSSAFGRAMESVDRDRLVRAVYPSLLARRGAGPTDSGVANALAAAAEGYPFPTNLDLDQPVGGLTPPSQAEIVRDALAAGASPDELARRLRGYAQRRATTTEH